MPDRNSIGVRLLLTAAAAIGGYVAQASPLSGAAETTRIGYNHDVRPILSDNCFACHGPDKSKRKAKLRLDDAQTALELKAIVPGKPGESHLIERIFSSDPKEQMPPPQANKKLTEQQKQTLKQWITQGAAYEPHWAYIAPHRPPVPTVKNRAWVRNPVDTFVLEQLEARGIAPAPEADRRTLLRRLSLDLIGLPPTPGEVQEFVEDRSPDAYEKQVERLLASPHYGERMAVPWLDAVRFADTVGFHGDQNVNVFPYRDFVIDAFNRNKPFDQFTIEQLAGDLLPNPTTEQLIATAFNRLNMVTREGGAQPKEYLAKYAADRVRTIGSAFLGSTLNCCECHDHKYDPFSTRDFYSMGAYFADIKQWGVYMDYNYTPNPDLKGWSNDHPFPPEIVVDSPYLKRRERRLMSEIDQTVAAADAKLPGNDKSANEFDAWRKAVTQFLHEHPDGWQVVQPIDVETTEDGVVVFDSKSAKSDTLEFALEPGTAAAIRLELLPSEQHGGSILRGNAKSSTVQVSASLKSQAGQQTRLPFYFADADYKEDRYSNGHAILGVADHWKTSAQHVRERQTAVYVLQSPLKATEGDRLVLSFSKDAIGSIRVSVSPVASLKPIDPGFAGALASALAKSPNDALVQRTFLLSTAWDAAALAKVRSINRRVLEGRDGKSPVVVTVSTEPLPMRVLPRGNWQDQSGAVVQPMPPHFLPQPRITDRRQTRLDLARWLVSPENPLTARVFVNRLWKQFFGAGICNTVEDLGAQGDTPSHPELLDWLAVEFRESGWDVKHMVRLMVTSNTYRQDSNPSPNLREIDPNNRLLACQSPRRLEAEFVRDNALVAAGLLNVADIGGPSVFPYQPPGYYANLQFPDRDYVPNDDEEQWRRGVYMHRQRTFLHPMLANFDAPSREDSVCTRVVSNTPQQALTLLNDPEFVEASRVLAEHALQAAANDDSRLDAIYQRALCRAPRQNEKQSLANFLALQRSWFRENPQDATRLVHVGIAPAASDVDAPELAAWTSVCRVVLNLHESITRY